MPSEREKLIAQLRAFSKAMQSRQVHGPASLMSLDLSIAQLRAMLVLGETGFMPMSPLAEELGITLSACSRLVDKLVQAGYVARTASPDDRRVVRCALTEKGKAVAEQVRQSMPFERQEYLDRVTVPELRVILRSMTIFQRVMAELQEAEEPKAKA